VEGGVWVWVSCVGRGRGRAGPTHRDFLQSFGGLLDVTFLFKHTRQHERQAGALHLHVDLHAPTVERQPNANKP
jgi:hypothetical protein